MSEDKKAKHTPGPWRIDIVGRHVGIRCGEAFHAGGTLAGGDRWITEVVCSFDVHEMSNETSRANARLIAAAPDLLEALKLMMDEHKAHWGADLDCYICRSAHAAIARATEAPE